MPKADVTLSYRVTVEWEEEDYDGEPDDYAIIDIADDDCRSHGDLYNWDIRRWK